MQVVFSHAERKGGKDFRYLQIDKDGYTIPVITVLVLWGRDEGWRDTSAFNFRKEHMEDYLEFLPVYSIPTISILVLNEEELEEMNDDLRIVSYAVKIAKGKMEMEEKMKYFEKLGNYLIL